MKHRFYLAVILIMGMCWIITADKLQQSESKRFEQAAEFKAAMAQTVDTTETYDIAKVCRFKSGIKERYQE